MKKRKIGKAQLVRELRVAAKLFDEGRYQLPRGTFLHSAYLASLCADAATLLSASVLKAK